MIITRYLLVGGYNAIIGYVIFLLIYQFFGQDEHYIIALTISYILSVTHAYWMQRIFVFRSKSNVTGEYGRFFLVNLIGFLLNIVMLSILVELGLDVKIAQAIALSLTILISYIGHKKFSFILLPP